MRKLRSGKRRGQAIIELIFSIIMFTALLALITSASVYLYVQHAVVSAAREGARIGALNPDIGGDDVSAGEQAVIDHVTGFMAQTTGINLPENDITITPPDAADPFGERAVTVLINYDMPNPVPVEGFLSALTGNSYGLDSIPVTATATMRYEE